jgi:LysR family transcriptional regulator for bpeEF and oprC
LNFEVDGTNVDLKMQGSLAVNDADAYVMCGVNGAGIIQAPLFMLAPHLAAGDLREILPHWKVRPMPLSVVYPHNRHLAPKVRAFVEWVAEVFEQSTPQLTRELGFLDGFDSTSVSAAPLVPAKSAKSKPKKAAPALGPYPDAVTAEVPI